MSYYKIIILKKKKAPKKKKKNSLPSKLMTYFITVLKISKMETIFCFFYFTEGEEKEGKGAVLCYRDSCEWQASFDKKWPVSVPSILSLWHLVRAKPEREALLVP